MAVALFLGGMQMRRRLVTQVVAAALAAAVCIGAPAGAQPNDGCSYGDARASFETYPLTFDGSPPPCTFRLFQQREYTFAAGEYFLGGVVRRESYTDAGSRQAAIDVLEALSFNVWIAPTTNGVMGPLVQQDVERTAIKSASYDPFGQHVWAQWGVITRLPVGQYTVITEQPARNLRWVVRLVITPS